ncbi:MAG TPA: TonB-dependent receptor [Opitutaceae bacterium]|nr:TonB-dependent receptor [Opitutaceae bacterium]
MLIPSAIRSAGARSWCFRGLVITLLCGVALGAPAQTPPVASPAGAVGKLPAVEVVGTRIRRLDGETVAPVSTTTREEIMVAGHQNLGEFTRSLPFTNNSTVDPQFGTGFASGATSLNLRGLGVNSTLVLVNGRRAAPYGLAGGNGFTTLFDYNSLPLSAIDRVEILKDGGSALYGSDAVAGVVNIKLRDGYEGSTVSAIYGNTTKTDSAMLGASATWGAVFGKTSVLITGEWQTRHSLFLRDRDFSKTADGRIFGGQDSRSTTGFPGYVVVPVRDPSGRTPPAGTITGTVISPQGVLLANPTIADFSAGASLSNFNEDTTMLPDSTYAGIYARVKHTVSERFHAFGELSWRQNTSDFHQAATPVLNTNERGTGAGNVIRLPFNNPYNPFGVDIDNFRFRLMAGGPRARDSDSTTTRYLAGLGGAVGPGDWTWESAVLYSKNEVAVEEFNWATDAGVQDLLNQTSRATALNPFGPSAPGVVESLAATLNRRSVVDVGQIDAHASGHFGRLPAGEIGVAIGAEYRRESMRDKPDPLAVTGGIVGLGGTSGLSGTRRVSAGYVEFSLPVSSRIEAQIAGRHEKYSDFGTASKPKFGVKYRATKSLLFRGAFSQSFRAPDLSQLYTAQTIVFSSTAVRDPLRPADPVAFVRQITGGNPALQPELGDSHYAGVAFDVPQVKNLELSLDFWRFHQRNLIGVPTLASILDVETTVPSGRVNRNPAVGDGLPGTINFVTLTFRNLSRAMTDGIDLTARYARSTELGRFTFNAAVTYSHSFEFNGVEAVKSNAFPMFRGNASIQWSRGNWGASLHGNYIDGYAELSSSIFGPGRAAAHRINHHYTFNPQLSYRGPWQTKFTIGARNVFDRDPPHALAKPELYDNLQVTGEGRFIFTRVTKEF